jgi:hypothetical protein
LGEQTAISLDLRQVFLCRVQHFPLIDSYISPLEPLAAICLRCSERCLASLFVEGSIASR